ncbi:MAG: hypothetical protein WD847_10140 [Pirellulales bacterium]
MPELLTDDELRHTALSLLQQQLGPVETLRFLALVRREPFDYAGWRAQHSADMSVEELFRRMEQAEARPSSK